MDRLIACLAVVGFVVSLFVLGDRVLARDRRRELGSWLIDDVRADVRVDALPRAFIEWFDALFRTRTIAIPRWLGGELYLPNFWRSALASFLALVAAFVVWLANKGGLSDPPPMEANTALLVIIYGSATVVTNIIPDYLSLAQSRWVLGRMSQTHSLLGKLVWLAVDVIATASIVFCFLWLSGWLLLPLIPEQALHTVGCLSRETFTFSRMLDIAIAGLTFSTPPGTLNYDVSGIYIFSSFFTSFWVWLYLGSGLLVRVAQLIPSLREFLRKACRVHDYPLRVLAVVSGLVAFALLSLPPLVRPLLPAERQGTNGMSGNISDITLCREYWAERGRYFLPPVGKGDGYFYISPRYYMPPDGDFADWTRVLQIWVELRKSDPNVHY